MLFVSTCSLFLCYLFDFIRVTNSCFIVFLFVILKCLERGKGVFKVEMREYRGGWSGVGGGGWWWVEGRRGAVYRDFFLDFLVILCYNIFEVNEMIVKYDFRSGDTGNHYGLQCDSDEIRQILRYRPDSLVWLKVYFPDGRIWYYHSTFGRGWYLKEK